MPGSGGDLGRQKNPLWPCKVPVLENVDGVVSAQPRDI